MSLPLSQVQSGGGGWIKPKEIQSAVAILIEVKDFEYQRPTGKRDQNNNPLYADSALCDVAVFMTNDDLDNATPKVSIGQRVEQKALSRMLSTNVGKMVLVTLDTEPSRQAQPTWVFRNVEDPEVIKKVTVYYENRQAKAAQAAANAPSFDD